MSMFRVLNFFLDRHIQRGNLTIIDADGGSHRFGDGTGEPVVVRLTNPALYWKLALFTDPCSGEAFMDGSLIMEQGSIYDLMELMVPQQRVDRTAGRSWLHRLGLRGGGSNPIGRAQRNVAHHYDLSQQFFELFLDRDMQYSCAYFTDAKTGLEQAQLAKKQHIAAKLALKPGMKVLDVGCGWGGLALYLAGTYDVEVVGVTLSKEQHKRACAERDRLGLQDRVDFQLVDYRKLTESFDRIVSVGMFEHVGLAHYQEYFSKLCALLAENGVALVHTIGRLYGPSDTSPWILKYIFPGGKIPALSEMTVPVERSGLYLCDLEVLRLHYALTLRQWRTRFLKNRKRAQLLYDERFCRMWEFYLASSEVAFRHHGLSIFQLQFSKHLQELPLTRTYMDEEESRLMGICERELPAEQGQKVARKASN